MRSETLPDQLDNPLLHKLQIGGFRARLQRRASPDADHIGAFVVVRAGHDHVVPIGQLFPDRLDDGILHAHQIHRNERQSGAFRRPAVRRAPSTGHGFRWRDGQDRIPASQTSGKPAPTRGVMSISPRATRNGSSARALASVTSASNKPEAVGESAPRRRACRVHPRPRS